MLMFQNNMNMELTKIQIEENVCTFTV